MSIIAHLEVSSEFEHMIYREAELDAIWSITEFFLVYESGSNRRGFAARLNAAALQAHDLVAEGRAADAATILRSFLDSSGEHHVVP